MKPNSDLRLVVRERRGRLVEDEQAGGAGQRPGDLDDLPLADPQRAHDAVDVEVHTQLVQDLPARRRIARHDTKPWALGIRPREMFSATVSVEASWNSWKMMATPRSRARRGVRAPYDSAVDLDLAGVRQVVAGDDLHERRLAGAVLTEQREDGAAGGVEIHPVEDLDATEGLANLVSRAARTSRLADSLRLSLGRG